MKGGQLKDDADMNTLNLKPGHSFMMMGSAGELPKEPANKVVFMEDMNAKQLAQASKSPPGLQNLGNTCYMNSTIQLLRAVPELQTELSSYTGPNRTLTSSLRDLYSQMENTSQSFAPAMFLHSLRKVYPQFAERSRTGQGYSQQDSEECWSQIMQTLRTNLRSSNDEESAVDGFMAGRINFTMTCDETDAEPPISSTEDFIKLNCHIGAQTSFMVDGIKDAMTDKIEKQSEVLGRNAVFTKTSKISRLPKYLTVNFVRFYFKPSIKKKAKILKKVKFPFEFDACELCTDDLRLKIVPVRDRVREIQKAEEDAERARKRTKTQLADEGVDETEPDQKMKDAVPEEILNTREEVEKMLDPELKDDKGCNPSGLYELVGVLTHSGASADSGHYQAWMKAETGDDWYRFNDDKVSIVSRERIEMLDGGGESDASYLNIYRSKW